MSLSDTQLDDMARQHGFDSFQKWVDYERTKRRVEEDEFRVNATRLMWGDEEAKKLKAQLEEAKA